MSNTKDISDIVSRYQCMIDDDDDDYDDDDDDDDDHHHQQNYTSPQGPGRRSPTASVSSLAMVYCINVGEFTFTLTKSGRTLVDF